MSSCAPGMNATYADGKAPEANPEGRRKKAEYDLPVADAGQLAARGAADAARPVADYLAKQAGGYLERTGGDLAKGDHIGTAAMDAGSRQFC